MFLQFWPAIPPIGNVFAVRNGQYADAATFVKGDLLIYSSGELTEAGADPTGIVGVALQDVATNPGFQAANNPTVSTGRQQTVSYAVANTVTTFAAKLTNNSATYIAPAVADIGVSYGVTVQNGIWTVDKSKTGGDARVVVRSIDITNKLVFVQFLDTAISD